MLATNPNPSHFICIRLRHRRTELQTNLAEDQKSQFSDKQTAANFSLRRLDCGAQNFFLRINIAEMGFSAPCVAFLGKLDDKKKIFGQSRI